MSLEFKKSKSSPVSGAGFGMSVCLRGLARCLCLVLCLLMVSCKGENKNSKSQTHERTPDDKLVIGFSIDTLALERWQRDLDVFMNRARELGAEVIVQNAGNNVEVQNKQILYLMEKQADVVVIVAKKRDSMTETIKTLRENDIPVISYDRLISNADISLYISVNTEDVGELMAKQFLKEKVGNNWSLILGPDEDFNMTLMQNGIKRVISGTEVNITNVYYTEGWNYDISYNTAVNLITDGELPDAIICGNDAVAGSVLSAFEDYLPGRNIPICGQDADIAACQEIVQGKQDFTVYKPITKLAEKAAECAVQLGQGKSPSELVPVGQTIDNGYAEVPVLWLQPQIVNKENIDEVIIKSGFHTSGEVYKE